jgi:benzoyl-CoA reductase/2-hydroxyglutaryl-CoA dehydratase subunit BcrC/BadD/HgdB
MNTDNLITPEGLAASLKVAVEGMKKKPGLMKSAVPHMELIYKYVNNIVTAKEKGKWVIAHGTQQPLEIYEAMDCVSLFNEFWGVISDVVKLESVPEALSISNSIGTAQEVCSFFKNMDGLLHAGKWPHTDMFVYATSSCDNVKSFHTLGRRYGIPDFGLERPYLPWTPHAMEFWKNEHKRLIAFLEEHTGKKLDYDRLKETVRLSYRLTELTLDIEELIAHVPTPVSAECFAGTLLAVRLFAGSQVGVDYLEGLKAELQERVDNGIAAANPERFRVMWSAFTPFWDTSLQAFVQQKYGAVSVCEVLSGWRGEAKWLIDPEDPLACLAYRSQLGPGNCQFSPSIDWAAQVVNQARKFKVDGAIFNNNWGCKQAAALGPLVRDELLKHNGVPTVTLNVDVLDATFTSRPEVEAQLDSFFEMIETSKAYKDRRNLK